MTNPGRKILVIDETLREGMQFQGMVFSLEQRIKIIEFQEALGIDVCQAGYPPAHPLEADIVAKVAAHAKKHNFRIRTAALGRAMLSDAKLLCDTNMDDPHFHLHIKNTITRKEIDRVFQKLTTTIDMVRNRLPDAMISIAMLDMGKTDPHLLTRCMEFLGTCLGINIISLPDTSGIMGPNQVYDRIKNLITKRAVPPGTKISIHCHNDMGMGSANSVMGILAGASVLEVSCLGIGERNGIADLFTTVKHLKNQDMNLGVDTDNTNLFRQYYKYINTIAREQTGQELIQYNTPGFGQGIKTHVAGTHSQGDFGTFGSDDKENFFLNLLCGRELVQKYLQCENIFHNEKKIPQITAAIKTKSITLGRRLGKNEITAIALSFEPGD